jgi:hypothetical protein
MPVSLFHWQRRLADDFPERRIASMEIEALS